jgi:hypothetical protein
MNTPHNVNPVEWQQNVGYARLACARIFRDGGSPADALSAFGLATSAAGVDWSQAVDRIAASLSVGARKRAA